MWNRSINFNIQSLFLRWSNLTFGSVLETQKLHGFMETTNIIKQSNWTNQSIKRKGTNQVTHTTVLLMLMSHSQPLDNKSNKRNWEILIFQLKAAKNTYLALLCYFKRLTLFHHAVITSSILMTPLTHDSFFLLSMHVARRIK